MFVSVSRYRFGVSRILDATHRDSFAEFIPHFYEKCGALCAQTNIKFKAPTALSGHSIYNGKKSKLRNDLPIGRQEKSQTNYGADVAENDGLSKGQQVFRRLALGFLSAVG